MVVISNRIISDLSKLEPLDGNNYKRWSQKLLMFFKQLEIDYVLFNDPHIVVTLNNIETTHPLIAIVKSNEIPLINLRRITKLLDVTFLII
ncbi:hypothetical protein vseg_015824 [Gypsophila vaccaria]